MNASEADDKSAANDEEDEGEGPRKNFCHSLKGRSGREGDVGRVSAASDDEEALMRL